MVHNNQGIGYYQCPCAFDIETTSFIDADGEKAATMYIWQLGLNDYIVIGRTWPEFVECLDVIRNTLLLHDKKRVLIYIHNLAFEFAFMHHWLDWINVFATSERKPLKCVCQQNIEFRCSYLLSGYSLADLAKQCVKYPCRKMTGDLDYDLPRHSGTPLTTKEMIYCINDVKVVMNYIREQYEHCQYITRLPLTKTGYVRLYCRDKCYRWGEESLASDSSKRQKRKYYSIISGLTLEPDEVRQAIRGYSGGFTHASAVKSGNVYQTVGSMDICSSYPATLVMDQYPISKAEVVRPANWSELMHYVDNYCCLMDVHIENLISVEDYEHPLSASRCIIQGNRMIDNGRLMSCDSLYTTITEQDFHTFRRYYSWSKFEVSTMRIYRRGYLPTPLVESVLDLYEAKTVLKGVPGAETEYLLKKGMLNSIYGCCVTSIIRPEYVYKDGCWMTEPPDIEEAVEHYNNSRNRFLFYPWGVWCAAYARARLFAAINSLKYDYIYSDTDSVKYLNVSKHQRFFDSYNDTVDKLMRKACEYHGFDYNRTRPKTVDGVEKPLGHYEFEGVYDRFKTLGAKRYLTETSGKFQLTVAGVGKKAAMQYILKYSKDPFDVFEDGLYIPSESTGKLTHTYIDDIMIGDLTDYRGVSGAYYEQSGIHLEPCDFTLGLDYEYADLLAGIRSHNE